MAKSRRLKLPGGKARVAHAVTPEKATGSTACACRHAGVSDPGAEIARHAHAGAARSSTSCSGGGELTVGSDKMPFGPEDGDLHSGGSAPHGEVTGPAEPTVAVQIYAPGGPEQRFRGATPPAASPQTRASEAGMNFNLTDDQLVLQKTVRDFCAKQVIPNAAAWDEQERFPTEVIPAMAELGLFGMQIPEEYGGAGMKSTTTSSRSRRSRASTVRWALTMASHNWLVHRAHHTWPATRRRRRSTCRGWRRARCWAPGG